MTATLHYAARKHMRELYQNHRWGLLTVLTLHADIRNRCWPSMTYLADEMGGIGLKTLTDAKKWLIEHGAIEIVPYGQRVGKEKQLPKRQHVYQLTGTMTINGETFPYLYSSDISVPEISHGKISPPEIIRGEISQGETKGITSIQSDPTSEVDPILKDFAPTGAAESTSPDPVKVEDGEKPEAAKPIVNEGIAPTPSVPVVSPAPLGATVVNVHSQEWYHAPDRVYVGRRTSTHTDEGWGNPFIIDVDGTREEVIDKYRHYILSSPGLLKRIPELRGKALGCWCKPEACHGDVLAELANLPDEELQRLIDKAVKDCATDAIVDLCYGANKDTRKAIYSLNGSLIGQCHKKLALVEVPTAARIQEFGKRWFKYDWRGKQGQRPTTHQVVGEWAKLMITGKETATNGHDGGTESVLADGAGSPQQPTKADFARISEQANRERW